MNVAAAVDGDGRRGIAPLIPRVLNGDDLPGARGVGGVPEVVGGVHVGDVDLAVAVEGGDDLGPP